MTLSWRVQKTWLVDGGHKSYIFTINFWEWGKSQQVQYIVERKQQTSFRIGKNIVLKKFIDLDLFKWPHFHWIYSRKICQKIDPWIRVNFRGSTFEKGPPPSLRLNWIIQISSPLCNPISCSDGFRNSKRVVHTL